MGKLKPKGIRKKIELRDFNANANEKSGFPSHLHPTQAPLEVHMGPETLLLTGQVEARANSQPICHFLYDIGAGGF